MPDGIFCSSDKALVVLDAARDVSGVEHVVNLVEFIDIGGHA